MSIKFFNLKFKNYLNYYYYIKSFELLIESFPEVVAVVAEFLRALLSFFNELDILFIEDKEALIRELPRLVALCEYLVLVVPIVVIVLFLG